MSTKYSADSRVLEGGVALTDHALHRYQQRTPHGCEISPQMAWQRGEDIKHPRVAQSDGEQTPPTRVRVYRHSEEWGIAFLVSPDLTTYGSGAEHVVVTACNIDGFDHDPTRAYLRSYGPHNAGGGGDE
jgi:hypothetical protein